MGTNSYVERRMIDRVYSLRLEERRRKLKRKANKGNNNIFRFPRLHSNKIGSKVKWVDINVPENLSLSFKKRESVCEFLEQVDSAIRSGIKIRLIFEDTKKISLDALTYLLAKIQKLRWYYGEDSITGTYPKENTVEKLLTDSGFFKILGVKSRKKYRKSSIRYVKYRSDTLLLGHHIQALKNDLIGDDFQLLKIIALKIVRAIKEAMSNVSHHAYHNKSLRSKKMRGRWWLTGHPNVNKNSLTLSFYDCGVGIPKTLVRQYGKEYVRKALNVLNFVEPDDSQMIEAAVQLGRSGTQQQNRGKGLQDMHELIRKAGGGSLTIHSRFGSYRYEADKTTIQNFSNFLEGTLITWELPLDGIVQNTEDLNFLNEVADDEYA